MKDKQSQRDESNTISAEEVSKAHQENPDLPIDFIRESLEAKIDVELACVTPYKRRS